MFPIFLKEYLISQEALVSEAGFAEFLLHSIETILVRSQLFELSLQRGDDAILLVESGCKVFGCQTQSLLAVLSGEAHNSNFRN